MIDYKGYTGVFEYDPETQSFHGRVVGIRDVVSFYGKSVQELKRELATSVDAYLEVCAEKGIEPAKPFSGRFNIRLEAELHRAVAQAAAHAGKSMNEWIAGRLAASVAAPSAPAPARERAAVSSAAKEKESVRRARGGPTAARKDQEQRMVARKGSRTVQGGKKKKGRIGVK